VQLWGGSQWGGCTGGPTPPTPTPPTIGDFERWERVHREPRKKHEQQTIHSVLFAVEGVTAKVRLGRPGCSTGLGTMARAGAARYLRCAVGAVEIQTGTGTWATAQAARSSCECGRAEAGVSVTCEISEGVAGNTDVGLTKARALRNPTDEEFLMMIAEML
jgi:hypothetical protein